MHRLSTIMAQERQLYELVRQHPTLDIAYFNDLRLALMGCNGDFARIYPNASMLVAWDAMIEQMEPEIG